MKDEVKVAIAKTVLGAKQKLMALIPTDEGILAETLLYADEIKDAPKEPDHPKVTSTELKMAKTLIDAMVQDFKPEDYKDEYQARLWEIINAKIHGK